MSTTTGNDLVAVLEKLGVDITTVSGTEVGARCPVHELVTGRADGTPSWSMNTNTGLWICYACGSRGNLPQLVTQLTGSADEVLVVNQFLIESGLERLKDRLDTEELAVPSPDMSMFRSFKTVPEHLLLDRHIKPDMAQRHGIRWDDKNEHWIIPIISPERDLWGWQAKSKGYFRNVPTGVPKSRTLFGADGFKSHTALLLESPLDVVRLASLSLDNIQGLAAFGAHVSTEQLNIMVSKADKIVVALDNDEAGISAGQRVLSQCPRPRGGIFFLRYEHTNAKDIGDMTNDEIEEAVHGATAIPWWL